MFSRIIFIALLLWSFQIVFADLGFVGQPSISYSSGSGKWTIDFEVSQATDVEVAVINKADTSILRHLAAGLLGANAPAPLATTVLHQVIEWDGKDDFGRTVSVSQSNIGVRVRAGMIPKLVALVGENLYSFRSCAGGASPRSGIAGLIRDADGSMLILGRQGLLPFLRRYDASGQYLQTVYPPQASLSKDSVTGYGVNLLPDGGWAPKTTVAASRTITNSLVNNLGSTVAPTRMFFDNTSGKIILVSGRNMQIMSKSGAFLTAGSKTFISTPAAPAGLYVMGPQYVKASHNPNYVYLSGLFYGEVDGGCWLLNADTSGFWGDGKVFKVNLTTGEAASWLKLDSVPVTATERGTKILGDGNNVAAIHGVEIDDSNHVFVCDRVHNRIGVYDTNTPPTLLGSVPCQGPDNLAVSRRTGALYVVRRTMAQMTLAKFTGWRIPGAATATTTLLASVSGYTGAPSITLAESGNTTTIWVGQTGGYQYAAMGVRIYRDDGASFTLLKDFLSPDTQYQNFERVAVNRATDKVYWVKYSPTSIYTIENWNNPVIKRIAGSLGDLTVAPDGFLYGLTHATPVPVGRYTSDDLTSPVNFANTSANVLTGNIDFEWGGTGEGVNFRGLAANWQGQVALFDEDTRLSLFPDTGCSDALNMGATIVSVPEHRRVASCVKFDPAGNFYVGLLAKGTGWIPTPGFTSDYYFNNESGSVVKFAAGTTGAMTGGVVTGAAKIYAQPFGSFTGDGGDCCTCTNPRFDVDPYGRLYIPNGTTSTITVVDNTGNEIMKFGKYGNTDSRGVLPGPGLTLSSTDIPIAWPSSVAASENYIYVGDGVNARLVRVKMDYTLDNMPPLVTRVEKHSTVIDPLAITASPNPFKPLSAIRVTLPASGNVRLCVYDMGGRLVRTVAEGRRDQGVHHFEWRGDDETGKPVSAGIYLYRLTAENKVVTVRTILSK
jgi:hypothetical protein